MKVLALFILTLFLGKSCESEAQKKMETAQLIYTANSRGFFQEIVIENHKLSIKKDRKGDAIQSKISDADWEELVQLFQEVNLDEIKNLKSPTEKRFYDGAAIAQLKINYDGKNYESQSFDHGFPPEAIKKIVTKINAFAK
ncbi:putative lipoprotein [Flavobacterium daejeonense]|nr:putative lipoprotein [Flavobacterium daejeonense]